MKVVVLRRDGINVSEDNYSTEEEERVQGLFILYRFISCNELGMMKKVPS